MVGPKEEFDFKPFARKLQHLREAAVASRDFSLVDDYKRALGAANVVVQMRKDGVDLEAGPGFDPNEMGALL